MQENSTMLDTPSYNLTNRTIWTVSRKDHTHTLHTYDRDTRHAVHTDLLLYNTCTFTGSSLLDQLSYIMTMSKPIMIDNSQYL